MTLRVWWATEAELLPWNVLQDRAPVIRLDDLREVVEGRIRDLKREQQGELQNGQYTQARGTEGGWHELERLLAQLKGVGNE